MVEDQVQDTTRLPGPGQKPVRVRVRAARKPPLTPAQWAFVRLSVLQGMTLTALARQMERDPGSFVKAARAAGMEAPEAPGERVRCVAAWQADAALAAMQAGNLAQADRHLRLVAAFGRAMTLAGQKTGEDGTTMTMTNMMGGRDLFRLPVDQLSEAEVRAELRRIMGIEVKTRTGNGDADAAGSGAVADDDREPVRDDGARGTDAAAG